MIRIGRLWRHKLFGIGLIVAVTVLAGCSSGAATRLSPQHTSLESGGTVYLAVSYPPNWIFPFADTYQVSVRNLSDFQYLMYRPLYWFGQITSAAPTFNEQLSFALPPVLANKGRTAVITLKGWKFSNGQPVDAQSVVFWMNMMMAEGRSSNPACPGTSCWGYVVPGEFPYNVVSYSAPEGPRGKLVTITFDRTYSALWLLYNALSQITPMPEAWDVTNRHGQPGSGGCGLVRAGQMSGAEVNAACQRVWSFDTDDAGSSLNPQMSADLDTYGTNPLWKVVDGPWRLSSYDVSTGEVSFVPNLEYSGPRRPILSKFVEVWYSGGTLAALTRGGPGSPDVAPIPTSALPVNTGPPGSTGKNLSSLAGRFNLDLQIEPGIGYSLENFDSTQDKGVTKWLFRQLYIRQALQLLVNQQEVIDTGNRGYGVPSYGPVPLLPSSPFLAKQQRANPYPPDPSKAVQLLKSHGWQKNGVGIDVCVRPGTGPGRCGRGIAAGIPLKFVNLYADDNGIWSLEEALIESSAWAQAGIQAEPDGESAGSLFSSDSLLEPCRTVTGISDPCGWAMNSWGGVQIYLLPDYLPTGDYVFLPGGDAGAGSYEDRTEQHLIATSEVSSTLGALYSYENYMAEQLPVVWQPSSAVTVYEVSKNLGGVAPFNASGAFTPEYWYWKSPHN